MSVEVINYLERFACAADRAGFKREVLAEVGGFSIPAYTKSAEGLPVIYLSSGVHGDEPAGPLALLEMLEDGFFEQPVNWLICPLLNPVGLTKGTRENGEGIDLNRDYLALKSEEVRAHVHWLKQQPVPDIFISLHEDWESSGFYLYEINVAGAPSAARAVLAAAAVEIPPEPEEVIDDHDVRESGWIDHPPTADFPKSWPEAIFLANRGAGVSYTLETPSSLELARRVACHQLAVKELVEGLLLTR